MSLFADKYHGTDMRSEDGSDWKASAETQLRVVCREQRAEIQRLEREVRRLKRELRVADEALRLAGTLQMKRKAAI